MPKAVGSLLQFVGGALTRVAVSGLIIGVFVVLVGVTPWEYLVSVIERPPGIVKNLWFTPVMTLCGLLVIYASLRFNLWSTKQLAIDALASELEWASNHLLHRPPVANAHEEAQQWHSDFSAWKTRVSEKLAERAFFTNNDQVYFQHPGLPNSSFVSNHVAGDHVCFVEIRMRALREILNSAQLRVR